MSMLSLLRWAQWFCYIASYVVLNSNLSFAIQCSIRQPIESPIIFSDASSVTPEKFLHFVMQRRPIVIRNAIKNSTLFRAAQSDKLLRRHLKDLMINAETAIVEDRNVEMLDLTFDEFSERYLHEKLYSVTADENLILSSRLQLPPFLCSLQGASNAEPLFWMSRGGTRSVIHSDHNENILFQLAGSKTFQIATKMAYKDLYINLQAEHYNESLCSPIFMDQPDIKSYPNYTNVQWHNVTVNAGDLIFLPTLYFHRVESSDERNLALNFFYKISHDPNEVAVHMAQFDSLNRAPSEDLYARECLIEEPDTIRGYQESAKTFCSEQQIKRWDMWQQTLGDIVDYVGQSESSSYD